MAFLFNFLTLPADIREAWAICEAYRRLGFDYSDVSVYCDDDELIVDLVTQGKARFVGVSNFKREQIEQSMQTRRIDVVQCGWNLFDRRMGREILPHCAENQIGVMAYGPLAYVMLTGTFSEEMHPRSSADLFPRRIHAGSFSAHFSQTPAGGGAVSSPLDLPKGTERVLARKSRRSDPIRAPAR